MIGDDDLVQMYETTKNKSSIFLWCDRKTDSAQQRNCKNPTSQTDAPKSRVLSYMCAYTSQLGLFELHRMLVIATSAASSVLKKGLLTVFPGLYKQKDLSRMKRNQYHLRVFQVSQRLVHY